MAIYTLVVDRGYRGLATISSKARRVEGKVLRVRTKNLKTFRYRWIVRVRPDGRLVVRTPRWGTLVRDLDAKRPSDYGKEHLLPMGALIQYSPRPRGM